MKISTCKENINIFKVACLCLITVSFWSWSLQVFTVKNVEPSMSQKTASKHYFFVAQSISFPLSSQTLVKTLEFTNTNRYINIQRNVSL